MSRKLTLEYATAVGHVLLQQSWIDSGHGSPQDLELLAKYQAEREEVRVRLRAAIQKEGKK